MLKESPKLERTESGSPVLPTITTEIITTNKLVKSKSPNVSSFL